MNDDTTARIKKEFKKFTDHIKVIKKWIDVEQVSLFKLLNESKEEQVEANTAPHSGQK